MSAAPLPFVRACGSPFAVGSGHGAARRESLRAFIGDSLGRLNRVMRPAVSMAELSPTISAYGAAIEAASPDLAAEIRGLAHGAGLSQAEATLLQLRREIMGYRKIPKMPSLGGCTAYARAGRASGGVPVLAQTIDLSGNLDDQITILDAGYAGSGRRALILSFAGLLGFVGLNSDGLAIGLNLVVGGDWHPGLPPYLAVRHLLNTAASVAEAVSILRDLPLASSRSIMLCDPREACYVEILGADVRAVSAPEITHTNHYLHPDLAPRDEVNVFARNSSLRRLEACRRGLGGIPAAAGVEDHFGLLCEPPIRVPDEGDISRDRTVATVVMLPAAGELYVRPGDPARTATQAFALRDDQPVAAAPAAGEAPGLDTRTRMTRLEAADGTAI
jgi:isopenicillin-N N-acyltransferase-like protein